MFVDLCQKKSLTDPTLQQSISEFRGPLLGHFPFLATPTKWSNGGPWASGLAEVAVKDDGIVAGVNQRPTLKCPKNFYMLCQSVRSVSRNI